MSDAVLDSSTILALLLNEPGSEIVKKALPGALLSTINLAEILTKLCERGMPVAEARNAVEALGVEMIDFTVEQACLTADLRKNTRIAGLSIGDRTCLALAQMKNVSAITADAVWATVPGLDVIVIREPKSAS